ncbi:MAG: GNAT family N-acetyltransferase, partial [Alsobacter sp.]
VDGVFAYASRPEVARYTLWEAHRTWSDAAFFVREYAPGRYADGVPEPLGIALRAAPDWVIGSIGVFWTARQHATMELGYALGTDHWGRGLIVEAARTLLDHAFACYPVERLQARVIVGNTASVRVVEKLGLRHEGRLRSSLFRRGHFEDVDYFAVLRGEWPATANRF